LGFLQFINDAFLNDYFPEHEQEDHWANDAKYINIDSLIGNA
jgi:hypothetical protein